MIPNRILRLVTVLALAAGARAQGDASQPKWSSATTNVQSELEASISELASLRNGIAFEKVPLNRALIELEEDLAKRRADVQQASRLLDTRTLDLSNLTAEIKARREESAYLSSLFGEYTRNLETRLQIAEMQRYGADIERSKLAAESRSMNELESLREQARLLTVSLERLEDALGGTRFEGHAVDPNGLLRNGTFVLVGPCALFRTNDGQLVGTAEQRLGSLEPALVPFAAPEDAAHAAELVVAGVGKLPLDPTLGNAHKVEATQESLVEHIQRGGPVMIPIFVVAGIALVIALYKWVRIAFVRKPSHSQLSELLDAIARSDRDRAVEVASGMRGPAGKMLYIATEHLGESRELIEEVMYEKVLGTRLKLNALLPFVAITASAAPLLGLLGTVTGIMNTFTLITVFGTGDVKTLSSGISEALITTEYGLYVAIPSLLLHAFLSRQVKAVIDHMESVAVSFLNQLGKVRHVAAPREAAPATPVTAATPVPVRV